MEGNEKIKFMNSAVKPILSLIEKRMKNKIDALKAYEPHALEPLDQEVNKMREIEAIKLRHEINVLKDLSDIVEAMYPDL